MKSLQRENHGCCPCVASLLEFKFAEPEGQVVCLKTCQLTQLVAKRVTKPLSLKIEIILEKNLKFSDKLLVLGSLNNKQNELEV